MAFKNPFYDSKEWRKFRAIVLKKFPICQKVNCGSPSRHVDHKIALRKGGAGLEWSNVEALCHSCHSRKTAARDGGFGNARSDRPLIERGCDENGVPVDPNHHWNRQT